MILPGEQLQPFTLPRAQNQQPTPIQFHNAHVTLLIFQIFHWWTNRNHLLQHTTRLWQTIQHYNSQIQIFFIAVPDPLVNPHLFTIRAQRLDKHSPIPILIDLHATCYRKIVHPPLPLLRKNLTLVVGEDGIIIRVFPNPNWQRHPSEIASCLKNLLETQEPCQPQPQPQPLIQEN